MTILILYGPDYTGTFRMLWQWVQKRVAWNSKGGSNQMFCPLYGLSPEVAASTGESSCPLTLLIQMAEAEVLAQSNGKMQTKWGAF